MSKVITAIYADYIASLAEFKKNPSSIANDPEHVGAFLVVSNNLPAFYVIPNSLYEFARGKIADLDINLQALFLQRPNTTISSVQISDFKKGPKAYIDKAPGMLSVIVRGMPSFWVIDLDSYEHAHSTLTEAGLNFEDLLEEFKQAL